MKDNQGSGAETEMVTWIGLFEITVRRLQNAWMDLYRDLLAPQSVEFRNHLTAEQRAEIAALDAADRRDAVQWKSGCIPFTREFDWHDFHCAGRFGRITM